VKFVSARQNLFKLSGPLASSSLLGSASKPRQTGMDKFDEIFELQDALNKRIGVNTDDMSDEEKAKWVLNYTRAMQQEIAELIDSVPWKWWAKYQEFDEQNARVEVVDLFHFLISIAQVLGMTPEDVYEAYTKKNKVNHKRQDSGYVKKDEADSKHI
jgi:dimeric dUTPase (all-alpha-NTP-PPase superfamily)